MNICRGGRVLFLISLAALATHLLAACANNVSDVDATTARDNLLFSQAAATFAPWLEGAVVPKMCSSRSGLTLSALQPDQQTSLWRRRATAALQCDAYDVIARVLQTEQTGPERERLVNEAKQYAVSALQEVSGQAPESSRLPVNSAHQQMYAIAAEAERTAGATSLQVWPTNPWAMLNPLDRAAAGSPQALNVTVMRGERRALAFNIRSAAPSSRNVLVAVSIPDLSPDALTIYQVNWTGTDTSNWVAAELEVLGDATQPRRAQLLPGITQQIWIQVHPSATAPIGVVHGTASITADDTTFAAIPIEISLLNTQFPDQLSMHFAGWDYTVMMSGYYGITASNRLRVASYLQSMNVDAPWADAKVLSWDAIDSDGNLSRKVDNTTLKRWLSEWPYARRYRVFLEVGDSIAEIPLKDSRFPHAVDTWIRAWANEIRQLGRRPEEFDLLLVDEPAGDQAILITQRWADAIRKSETGFRIWTDPLWKDPDATPSALIDVADTVTINIAIGELAGNKYWDWARKLASMGKNLEVDACQGPSTDLDPYAYYRLATWRAVSIGATAVSFWGFADTGGASSDNEFAATRLNYSPLFSNTIDVRSGKQMEAAVEGLQDAEYLRRLREIASTHGNLAVRTAANALLNRAISSVLAIPPSSYWSWRSQKKPESVSTEADRQRIEIGRFLDSLD